MATHKTGIIMFPAVLESTSLTAFDLSKIIENFVRHEETLRTEKVPKFLRRTAFGKHDMGERFII